MLLLVEGHLITGPTLKTNHIHMINPILILQAILRYYLEMKSGEEDRRQRQRTKQPYGHPT